MQCLQICLFRVSCESTLPAAGGQIVLNSILLAGHDGQPFPATKAVNGRTAGRRLYPLTAVGVGEMFSNAGRHHVSVLMFSTSPHDCRKTHKYIGEAQDRSLRLSFNAAFKVAFRGSRDASEGGHGGIGMERTGLALRNRGSISARTEVFDYSTWQGAVREVRVVKRTRGERA